jgi:hypothetical protein
MARELDADENVSASCWTVEERAWKQELPDLPDEVIALLASPVVVTASAFRGTTVAARPQVPVERAPQFLAPAPARSVRRTVGRTLQRRQPARVS